MKIKWNLKAFEEIRRMDTVDSALKSVVDGIADRAGEGYVSVVEPGKTRSRGAVVTAEIEAVVDNSENNTLVRELGAAGWK